jgi:hypothetical protein
LAKGASLNLIWVPGHTDIAGNEEADKLAKKAIASNAYLSDKTSFAFLGIQINQLKKQEILDYLEALKKPVSQDSYSKIYSWKISKKINLPLKTKRELASSFFQLKLGHGYLKAYLHRLNIISTDKCIMRYKRDALFQIGQVL